MDKLVTLYKQRLNLEDATFSRIDHTDATVATVYKITQPTGAEFILKICTRTQDYLHELYFLTFFAQTLPIPRILELVPPETDIPGALLMEFLPGTLLSTSDLTDSLAYEIGAALARIHLNQTKGYGDLTRAHTLNPDPRVYFTQKFQEGISECSNHLPNSTIDQCQNYFDAHVSLLDTVDGPCITHRDFRPGNLLVHNGTLQGIIDWSAARASFAQEDFCFLDHEDWQPHNKFSFLAGYRSIRAVPDYKHLMPLLRVSRALAIIGFTVKRGTWNSSAKRVYQINRQFLEMFFT